MRGFTLIELMIVVAIVGILASIALPSYQDYTVRARVVEGLSLADGAKTVVEDVWISSNSTPLSPLPPSLVNPTSAVQGVNIDSTTGTITVTYASQAGAMNGHTLTLTPNLSAGQPVTWVCKVDLPANDKYVPPSCRL